MEAAGGVQLARPFISCACTKTAPNPGQPDMSTVVLHDARLALWGGRHLPRCAIITRVPLGCSFAYVVKKGNCGIFHLLS